MIDVGIYDGKLIITDERNGHQIVFDDPSWIDNDPEQTEPINAIDTLITALQVCKGLNTGVV